MGYTVEWDGKAVTLPPAGPMNPDGSRLHGLDFE